MDVKIFFFIIALVAFNLMAYRLDAQNKENQTLVEINKSNQEKFEKAITELKNNLNAQKLICEEQLNDTQTRLNLLLNSQSVSTDSIDSTIDLESSTNFCKSSNSLIKNWNKK